MPYTRGLLREAMRLYPVAPFLTRLMPNTTLKVQQHGVGHLKYFEVGRISVFFLSYDSYDYKSLRFILTTKHPACYFFVCCWNQTNLV